MIPVIDCSTEELREMLLIGIDHFIQTSGVHTGEFQNEVMGVIQHRVAGNPSLLPQLGIDTTKGPYAYFCCGKHARTF